MLTLGVMMIALGAVCLLAMANAFSRCNGKHKAERLPSETLAGFVAKLPKPRAQETR